MSDDILHHARNANVDPQLQFTPEMYNQALIYIEDICLLMVNKVLQQFGMPSPNRAITDVFDREIQREKNYDTNALNTFVQLNMPNMNQQKHVYDTIMQACNTENGGIYFLDAPGGTEKTYLISLILATIRSNSNIALEMASSGIAATLLDGGRTAHSALKLPLNMQMIETPKCNISRASAMAKVLQQCKIIVWDECTMAHKKSLEALDGTLQDLRSNQRPLGGALILLSGDFRQTLHLFTNQLLEIGNGQIAVDNATGLISLPTNFCVVNESKEDLIPSVYPDIVRNYTDHQWLSERAILAAKNKDVSEINFDIQSQISAQTETYKSIDCVLDSNEVVNYPTEFLNSHLTFCS